MSTPRVRDFHEDDLDQVVRVWEESRSPERGAVYGLAEVLGALRDGGTAVVAAVGEVVVGAAVARVGGDRGWVVLLALANDWRGQGLGSAMLTELERRLMARGVHRLSALLAEGETGVKAFRNCGYETRDLTYFERVVPLQPQEIGLLDRLGGRMLPRGLWGMLAGMEREKQLIERRVVLPLVDPDLAEEYGVVPPRAIVLFGPPGTGKTTFAKAVASRLGWPFVEVFPSRLAAAGDGLALALRETFTDIEDLEHAVVFIDEVEEIAGARGGKPPSPVEGVTNELLKIIPGFRERRGRLLVCATNFVRALIRRCCATDDSTTSSPSALPTPPLGRQSGDATSPPVSASALSWDRSSRPAICSLPPTSSSPPEKGHSAHLRRSSTVSSISSHRRADPPPTTIWLPCRRPGPH